MTDDCIHQTLSLTSEKLRCRKIGKEVQKGCKCDMFEAEKEVNIKLDLEEGQLGIF